MVHTIPQTAKLPSRISRLPPIGVAIGIVHVDLELDSNPDTDSDASPDPLEDPCGNHFVFILDSEAKLESTKIERLKIHVNPCYPRRL